MSTKKIKDKAAKMLPVNRDWLGSLTIKLDCF